MNPCPACGHLLRANSASCGDACAARLAIRATLIDLEGRWRTVRDPRISIDTLYAVGEYVRRCRAIIEDGFRDDLPCEGRTDAPNCIGSDTAPDPDDDDEPPPL